MLETTAEAIKKDLSAIFAAIGADNNLNEPGGLNVNAPALGESIATIKRDTPGDVAVKVEKAAAVQKQWAEFSRGERGQFLNLLSENLKKEHDNLAKLITYEGGKKPAGANAETTRGWGVISSTVKDAALADINPPTGESLGRERTSTPVGVVGVITSYNFPLAVGSWNIAPALLAGNSVIWKPSEKTPLTALAYKAVFDKSVAEFNKGRDNKIPPSLLQIVIGEREVGEALVDHEKTDLISATGSTGMGHGIRKTWSHKRNNRIQPILELGGNNAVVISKNCNPETLEFAVNSILNSVFQSGGQFCTNTRRLIIHEDVYDVVINKLREKFQAYIASGAVSNPLLGDVAGDGQSYAPLIDKIAYDGMQKSLQQAAAEGGTIVFGQRIMENEHPNAYYTNPALVEMPDGAALNPKGVMAHETFAPVLFVTKYSGDIENAIEMVNAPANARLVNGLYTNSLDEAQKFKRMNKSGDTIINTQVGTVGVMRSGMGFGGDEDSGQGVVLDSSNPLGPFTEKAKRATTNKNIELK